MVELTRRRLEGEQLAHGGFGAEVADVHALRFPSGSFSLVIAVGLLPWLHQPELALAEIARVLRGGGSLVLTADNRARLNTLVDPRSNLLLTPLKRLRKRLARQRPVGGATSRLHFPSHVNALLRRAGFRIERRSSVGFGPFTLWSRVLLADAQGIALHRRLQALADRDVPGLRFTGWHYLVRARKQS
jgi:ubiquinone/menaquinone biosynthesis C-methylase UbiE